MFLASQGNYAPFRVYRTNVNWLPTYHSQKPKLSHDWGEDFTSFPVIMFIRGHTAATSHLHFNFNFQSPQQPDICKGQYVLGRIQAPNKTLRS